MMKMFEIPNPLGIIVISCMLIIGMLAIAWIGAFFIQSIDAVIDLIRSRHGERKRKRFNRCLHCNKIHPQRFKNDFFCSDMCEYLHKTNDNNEKGENDDIHDDDPDQSDN